MSASLVLSLLHSDMKSWSLESASPRLEAIGWFAAMAQNEAPNIVSGLVVNTSRRSSCPLMLKKIVAPSERPIQLCCISLTLSGHRSRVSIDLSKSSLYSVIFKNHCDKRRFSTGAPERHPLPSMTCSLARTVFSTGSQFTQLSFR